MGKQRQKPTLAQRLREVLEDLERLLIPPPRPVPVPIPIPVRPRRR